jgi:hypothetical protein
MPARFHRRNPCATCRGLLLCAFAVIALDARAESPPDTIYRCVAADGRLAFQDRPCVGARQSTVTIAPPPPFAPPPVYAAGRSAPTAKPARTHRRAAGTAEAVSYECRSADGQRFYRHSPCPGFVPASGNAMVRGRDGRARHPRRAEVAVSGRPIPRARACREIHRAGAIGRDGRVLDEDVSTYERNLGRDPCR